MRAPRVWAARTRGTCTTTWPPDLLAGTTATTHCNHYTPPLQPLHPPTAGITNHCMTLSANFRAPLIREWCLLHGLRSCSRRSCINMLQRAGNSILLVPGGAAEAITAAEGCYEIVLNKRKVCIGEGGVRVVRWVCAHRHRRGRLPVPVGVGATRAARASAILCNACIVHATHYMLRA